MQDYSIILNRLKKNYKSRKSLIKAEKTSAYRLYEKDIPEYPFIVDIYNDFAVIYEKGKRLDPEDNEQIEKHHTHKKDIIQATKETLGIQEQNIILKERSRKKGNEQYTKISRIDDYQIIQENGMKLRVNLFDYLDTGLFLDHRPLRKIIKENSLNKVILNLFAYTGSISVAAALGGAKSVTTVDMSKKYVQWAEENFKENNIETKEHSFIQEDVLKYLDSHSYHNQSYDTIILDPPSFSNSKRMEDTFNVQDFHEDMLLKLMARLKPNGTLYFSNNFRKFKLSEKIQDLFKVKKITFKTIPKDFRDQKIHICFEIQQKNL